MKKSTFLSFLLFFICVSINGQKQSTFTNPVIREDVADPSIVMIGNTYYASGTSSEWAPFYPFFESKDLVNWTQKGHLFQKQPEWTTSSFWAPELFHHRNKLYVYYTARNKNRVSYIGVASTDHPDHPFTDHGVIVEWGTEAIDAFVLEDNGELYISWKAYGLDKRPIELLACKLSDDGLRLAGEPFTLLKDEEGIGMEGQHWFKKGDYYYILYSTKSCCGPKSDYQVYVARSKEMKGPYEKYPGNPILQGDGKEILSCGHGTLTTTPDGRMFYLFHAYLTGSGFYQGRQVMLQEAVAGDDNWIRFTTGNQATLIQKTPFNKTIQSLAGNFEDRFKSSVLSNKWTWNYPYSTPKIIPGKGKLSLSGTPKSDNQNGTALCIRPNSPYYTYETRVINRNSGFKGLTMYGDDKNSVAFGSMDNRLLIKTIKNGKETTLTDILLPVPHPFLKIEVNNGSQGNFFWSADGNNWIKVQQDTEHPDLGYLVRWDRVARPGLIHIGAEEQPAEFGYFKLIPVK
ncbi:MAG: family 43 glycosylhydrolase [Dysgonamonadaceae bacterium]|jgi:beta-xylosidase|nr:family 43 glycosylhydrolase [Dysgonamonadaceae bacterium]